MRVLSAKFDSYGERSNFELDLSHGNFLLVYGRNETGKSTTLNFIRDVLFGAPEKKPFFSFDSYTGGKIRFELKDGRQGTIARRWERNGKKSTFSASLFDPESGLDRTIDEPTYLQLFKNANRNLFASFFGFSYQELAKVGESMKSSDFNDLIYGMLLGDSERLKNVSSELEKGYSGLFKSSKASKSSINATVAELLKARKELDAARVGTSRYRALTRERDEVEALSHELLEAYKTAEEERNKQQKYSEAWTHFQAYVQAVSNRDALLRSYPYTEEQYASFGEQDDQRRKEWLLKRQELTTELADEEGRLRTAIANLDALERRRMPRFIAKKATIQELSNEVKLIKEKRLSLPEKEKALTWAYRELVRRLQQLGACCEDEPESLPERYLAKVADGVVDEVERLAKEEEEAVHTENEAAISYRLKKDEFDRLDAERDELRSKMVEAFGDEDKRNDVQEFETIASEFSGIKASVDVVCNEFVKLKESLDLSREEARTLFSQVMGVETYETDEFEQFLTTALHAVCPLQTEFDELTSQYKDAKESLEAAENETKSISRKIEMLNAELEKERDAAVSYDELFEVRRMRDEYWERVKSFWFAPQENALEIGASVDVAWNNLTRDYEDLRKDADSLADKRYEHAEQTGKVEEIKRNRDAYLAELNGTNERKNKTQERLTQIQERADVIWRRIGLEQCSRLSIDAAKEWIDAWNRWRETRRSSEIVENKLTTQANELIETLRNVRTSASTWLDEPCSYVDGDSSDSDLNKALTNALTQTEQIVNSAKLRVETYESLWNACETNEKAEAGVSKEIKRLEQITLESQEQRRTLDASRIEFCRRLGFSFEATQTRGCLALKESLSKLSLWQDDVEEYRRNVEAYHKTLEELESYDAEIDAASIALGVECSRKAPEDDASAWRDLLDAANQIESEWNLAAAERDRLHASVEGKKAQLQSLETQTRNLEASVHVPHEDFERFQKASTELRELERLLQSCNYALHIALPYDESRYNATLEELSAINLEQIQENKRQAADRAEDLHRQFKETERRLGELSREIAQLAGSSDEELQERAQRAVVRLRNLIDVYAPQYLAHKALSRWKEAKKAEIEDVWNDAGAIFQTITRGRYSSVQLDKDANNDEFIVKMSGSFTTKKPSELSAGTREQLYLSLRLAHLRRYCANEEPLPILADDVLVNFDSQRSASTLDVLKQMADEGDQIVLLTCRESTYNAFVERVGLDSVIKLDTPGIST